jgi:hypothetical protein
MCLASGVQVRFVIVDPSPPSTSPTAEKPKLTDAERVERLKLLAKRLRDPDAWTARRWRRSSG